MRTLSARAPRARKPELAQIEKHLVRLRQARAAVDAAIAGLEQLAQLQTLPPVIDIGDYLRGMDAA